MNNKTVDCPVCMGTGAYVDGDSMDECYACQGEGYIEMDDE